jgi:hypothetical protein
MAMKSAIEEVYWKRAYENAEFRRQRCNHQRIGTREYAETA